MVTVNVQITANLHTNAGTAVVGRVIDFFYKLLTDTTYTPAGTGTTDANGNALSSIVPMDTASQYDIEGEWNGDTVYSASMQVSTFAPGSTQQDSTSILSSVAVLSGSTIDVMGTLVDSTTGALVAGQVLTILLNNVAVGNTAPTANDGTFTFSEPGVAPGSYTVGISFAGTTTLLSSTTSSNVTVPSGTTTGGGTSTKTLLGVGAAVGALIVVGGVAVASRTKKPKKQ